MLTPFLFAAERHADIVAKRIVRYLERARIERWSPFERPEDEAEELQEAA
jgi:hypothetical protein